MERMEKQKTGKYKSKKGNSNNYKTINNKMKQITKSSSLKLEVFPQPNNQPANRLTVHESKKFVRLKAAFRWKLH